MLTRINETLINHPAIAGVVVMRLIDRTGDRYGRLTVIERLPAKSKRDTNARWICRCDCSRPVIAYGGDLGRGKVKSCGCLNAERIVQHGMSHMHVYHVWRQMRQRCENPNAQRYADYGGRGIKVCERWDRFENFFADMGNRPKGFSLDRIDVNGDYCKENCRWATTTQQANNTRRNRFVEFNGETATLGEWATKLGIGWLTLRQRLDRLGWSVEQAFTTTVEGAQLYELSGRKQTLQAWSDDMGINIDTVRARLTKLNWSLERALTTPAGARKGQH